MAVLTIATWVSLGFMLIAAGILAFLTGCRRLIRVGKPHLLGAGLLLILLGGICLWIAQAASAAV